MKNIAVIIALIMAMASVSYAETPSYSVKSGISYSAQWGVYIANVVEKDGKTEKIIIDRLARGNNSSKELKDNYGIKRVSTINKDWWEQTIYFEGWAVEHGLDALRTDDNGHALNPDLISGATINVAELAEAVKNAYDGKTEDNGYTIRTGTQYNDTQGLYIANVIFKDGGIIKTLVDRITPNGEDIREQYDDNSNDDITSAVRNALTTTLIYSDHEPLGNMRTRFLNDVFFPAVEKESNGRIKINPHWNGEICISYENLNTIKDGTKAQISVVVPEYSMKELPLHQLFKSFPTGPTGQEQVNFFRCIYAEVPELSRELDAQNIHPIIIATGYPAGFFSAKPLARLQDLKGQTWRSASFWHKDFLANIGATPVTMPWGPGVSDALANGTLDGLIVNIDSGYDIQAHKPAPNILASKSLWLGHEYIIAMNKDIWESLPAEDKKAIERAAESSYSVLGGIMDEAFPRMLETLRADGAEVRLLNDEEVAYWEKATDYRSIQDNWVKGQNVSGISEALDAIRRIIGK